MFFLSSKTLINLYKTLIIQSFYNKKLTTDIFLGAYKTLLHSIKQIEIRSVDTLYYDKKHDRNNN
jgi:hypothetical protein